MISPHFFIEILKENGINFFTGIPDSLLKNICAYITDHSPNQNHIIAANEGAAISLAAGHYLATQQIPVVYMQNSGIGNAINPLMSLTDKEIYNIPLILLIGWRGEPGIKDEPQHVKQGKVTLSLLEAMAIKYAVLSQDEDSFSKQLSEGLTYIKETKEPYAFVIQKNTFSEYKLVNNLDNEYTFKREEAIQTVVSFTDDKDVLVSTTGMISRELFEFRESVNQGHEKDFLTVGSMGHASQIALGIALEKPERKIYCLDGDGATIMHMGSLAIVGSMSPSNYIHIIFNNGAHDSVGGQPTAGLKINIPQIAFSCGYKYTYSVDGKEMLVDVIEKCKQLEGPILIEVKVKKGARKDLGRPTTTPVENKKALISFMQKNI